MENNNNKRKTKKRKKRPKSKNINEPPRKIMKISKTKKSIRNANAMRNMNKNKNKKEYYSDSDENELMDHGKKIINVMQDFYDILPNISKLAESKLIKDAKKRYNHASEQKEIEVINDLPDKFEDIISEFNNKNNDNISKYKNSNIKGPNSHNTKDKEKNENEQIRVIKTRYKPESNKLNYYKHENSHIRINGDGTYNRLKSLYEGGQTIDIKHNNNDNNVTTEINSDFPSQIISTTKKKLKELISECSNNSEDNRYYDWNASKNNKKEEELDDNGEDNEEIVIGNENNMESENNEYNINYLYTRVAASVMSDNYFERLKKANEHLSDDEIKSQKIEIPEIAPSFVPYLTTPAYGRIPQCILGTSCCLYTSLKHEDLDKPYIGHTYLCPIELQMIREGVPFEIDPGPCYLCLCATVSQIIYNISANGERPKEIHVNNGEKKSDYIFGGDDDNCEYNENSKLPQGFKTYNGIILPFVHPVSKPGGYDLRYVHNQLTGFSTEITDAFRKITFDQFEAARIIVQWKDLGTGEIYNSNLPCFKEKSELFFRLGSNNPDHQVNAFVYSSFTIKPLTTELLLRKQYKLENKSKAAIYNIGGNVNYIFRSIRFDKKKPRQRGILMESIKNDKKQMHLWEANRLRRKNLRLNGKPFNYIFTQNIEKTESVLEDLLLMCNYMKKIDYSKIGNGDNNNFSSKTHIWKIEYPHFTLHQEVALPEQDLEIHKRYHAMLLRINISIALLKYEKQRNIIPKKAIEESSTLINKLCLFIEGHEKLIAHFSLYSISKDKFYLDDKTFDLIPKNKNISIPSINKGSKLVKEFRTYGELTKPISDCILSPFDMKYTEEKHTLIRKKPPHFILSDFFENNILILNYSNLIPYKLNNNISEFNVKFHIFHQFSETEKWVADIGSKNDGEMLLKIMNLLDDFKYWMPVIGNEMKSIFKKNPYGSCFMFNTFISLLIRVNFAEKILQQIDDIIQCNGNVLELNDKNTLKEIIYTIKLYSQTHMALACFMCSHSIFDNNQLNEHLDLESNVYDSAKPTYYTLYYPGFYDFECEDTEVALSHYCSRITFISHNEVDDGIWCLNMAKKLPKCCQGRTIGKKNVEACSSGEYYEYLKTCFMLSMSGLYRNIKNHINFEKRLKIYAYINELHDEKEFKKFVKKNKNVICTVVRENLLFHMKFDKSHMEVVKSYFPKWSDFESLCSKLSNKARLIYLKTGSVCNMEDILEQKNILKPVFRRNALDFIEFMVSRFHHMNKLLDSCMNNELEKKARKKLILLEHDKKNTQNNLFININKDDENKLKYINTPKSRRKRKENINEQLRIKLAENIKFMPPHIVNLIDNFVHQLTPGEDIPFDLLYMIGITDEGVDNIKKCYKMYTKKESLKTTLEFISMLSPCDYEMCSYFFECVRNHYSIRIVNLSRKITEKQLIAAKNKYGLDLESKSTPFSVRSMIFSPCCNNVNTFFSQRDILSSMGSRNVSKRSDNGELYCSVKIKEEKKKVEKNKCKLLRGVTSENKGTRISKVKLMMYTERIRRKNENYVFGITTPEYKKRYKKICKETNVVRIPSAGYIIEYGEIKNKKSPASSFTICPNCGTHTKFAIHMFGPNGFTCGYCDYKLRESCKLPRCEFCKNPKLNNGKVFSTKWKNLILKEDRPGYVGCYKSILICPHCKKSSIDEVKTDKISIRDLEIIIKKIATPYCEADVSRLEHFNIANSNLAALNNPLKKFQ